MSAQQYSCPAQETMAESVFELEEWRLDSESQASLIDVVPVADIDVVPVMDRLQASLDSSASSQSVQSPQAFVDLCAQSQASAPPSAQSAPGKRNKRKRDAQDEALVGRVERLTQALSACDTLNTREAEDECICKSSAVERPKKVEELRHKLDGVIAKEAAVAAYWPRHYADFKKGLTLFKHTEQEFEKYADQRDAYAASMTNTSHDLQRNASHQNAAANVEQEE
ncbi:uncharacterized protein LOC144108705 [Amblyomma americanum]